MMWDVENSLPAVPEELRGQVFQTEAEFAASFVYQAPDPPFTAPFFPSVFQDLPGVPSPGVGPPSPKWLVVVPASLAGFANFDDATAINWALSRSPTVMLLPYVYQTFTPVVIPPLAALRSLGGSSLAYFGGATPMPLGGPVITPAAGFGGTTIGGQAVNGVIVMVSQVLGGYATGSGNQALAGVTVDGRQAPAGVNGLEAWGPVWGVQVQGCGIFGMPNFGVATSSSAPDGTGKAPDLWNVQGTHIAGCGSDGWNVTGGVADSYFQACESTGNAGNGWNMTGGNQRWVACKAEFNTLNGWRLLAAGGSGTGAEGAWLEGCSTDHNGQDGVNVYGVRLGPVCLDGCTLHGDGYQAGAGGGGFAGLRVASTSTAYVIATGLRVLTVSGATPFPQYGVRSDGATPSVVKLGGAGLVYGNTAATNTTSTGTITTGADVLTGTGAWGS